MARTPNVKVLRDNMRSLGWHITAFDFYYNKCRYIVLFEDSKALGYKGDLVIAILTFVDTNNESRRLTVEANQGGFDGASAREIMDYFHIHHRPSVKGFFVGFYEAFNSSIPQQFAPPQNRHVRELCAIQLANRDNEPDPLAFCCYDARRNPVVDGVQRHRTVFNSNKTKLLRSDLFELLGGDDTISFFFRRENEYDDMKILQRFREREQNL